MLECLQLRGVRSYSPHDDATLTFDPKLTIIHGHNGAGKTTIIEALKVVTTGLYPPNSEQGRTFVTDPKLANLPEVHAAVRIRFKTHRGKTVKAAKLITVTRRSTKLSIKSSECQVAVMNPEGKFETKSMNVSTFEQFIPELLGVSSAVLENVTFCHQDRTLWPFSDSSELKGIFDEIFSTEVYSKAQDTHRKYLKAKEQIMVEKKRELDVLREREETFKQKRNEMMQIEQEIAKTNEDLEDLSMHLKTLREKEEFYRRLEGKYQLFTKQRSEFEGLQHLVTQLKSQLPHCDQSATVSPADLQSAEQTLSSQSSFLSESANKHRRTCDFLLTLTVKNANLQQNVREIEEDMRNRREKVREMCELLNCDAQVIEEDEFAICELESISENALNASVDRAKSELESSKAEYNKYFEGLKSAEAAVNHSKKCLLQKETELQSMNRAAQPLQKWDLDGVLTELARTKDAMKGLERESERLKLELNNTLRDWEEVSKMAKNEQLEIAKFALWVKVHELFSSHQCLLRHERENLSDLTQSLRHDWERQTQEVATQRSQLQVEIAEVKATEGSLQSLQSTIDSLDRELAEVQPTLAESLLVAQSQGIGQGEMRDWSNSLESRIREIDVDISDLTARKRVIEEIRDNTLREKACEVCRKPVKREEVKELKRGFDEKLQKLETESQEKAAKRQEWQQELLVLSENREKFEQFCGLQQRKEETEANFKELEAELRGKTERKRTVEERLMQLESVATALKAATAAWELLLSCTPQPDLLSTSYIQLHQYLSSTVKPTPVFTFKLSELAAKKDAIEPRLQVVTKSIDTCRSESLRLEQERNRIQSEQIALGGEDRTRLETAVAVLRVEIAALEESQREWRDKVHIAKVKVENCEKDWSAAVSKQSQKKRQMEALKQAIDVMRKDGEKRKALLGEVQKAEESAKAAVGERDALAGRIQQAEKLRDQAQSLISLHSSQQLYSKQSALIAQKLHEMDKLAASIQGLQAELTNYSSVAHSQNTATMQRITMQASELSGKLSVLTDSKRRAGSLSHNVTEQVARAEQEIAGISQLVEEHKLFIRALDNAIMSYHSLKISQVNALLRDFWRLTYRGHDIDTIELRAEPDLTKKVKTYNYRLVLHGVDSDMDMRGRCSAGQKVLSSIVLRLALAQAFSGVCGVIALDEPTTNLDTDNSVGLAEALANFVAAQKGVQMIVITHDREFVEVLLRLTQQGTFYQVQKVKDISTLAVKSIR